jgi:hypothetical protein
VYLTRREVVSLDRAGLIEFLSRRIPEGHHIDYKQALSGNSRSKQFTEFLKDTTAFANANGGHIIIGVKEPDGSTEPEDLMVGIEGGEELAHDLERLASGGSIDPPISGLIVQPVPIADNRCIIVVHIPSSMAKPHMVVYDKRTYLPQRHSESAQPMTSYDIRQAVLTSATTEDRATRYAEAHRTRMVNALRAAGPCFVLQATPLIPAHPPLDVYTGKVIDALMGSYRNSQHGGFGLGSVTYPRPTVEGIQGTDSRDDPQWITEVHRTGYVAVAFRLIEYDRFRPQHEGPYCIHEHHQHLFLAFGELCEEVSQAADFDPPFVLGCLFQHSRGTYYVMSQIRHSDACERDNIVWPSTVKQPGEPFRQIMDEFIDILYYAYGLRREELTQQRH